MWPKVSEKANPEKRGGFCEAMAKQSRLNWGTVDSIVRKLARQARLHDPDTHHKTLRFN